MNEEFVDDITCVVVFFDKRLIAKNMTEIDKKKFRAKDSVAKSKFLVDLTTKENIVMEDENEHLSTRELHEDESSQEY
jgi:hypothetical protein